MTTNTIGLAKHTLRAVQPILTSLLGALSIGGGIYGFVSPVESARTFGMIFPSDEQKTASRSSSQGWQHAYVKVQGIRNIGSGLSLLGLTAFWKLSNTCRISPLAEMVVRRCLGIALLAGSVVGFGDSYIVSQFTREEGVDAATVQWGRDKSIGHALMALPIVATGLLLCYD